MESFIKEPLLLKLSSFCDDRGEFFEGWRKEWMNLDFVQDNFSISIKKNTIRGLHYQLPPFGQTKLVNCICGAIMDIVVDLRKESPNFLKWKLFMLSETDREQLIIPPYFAHGYKTLCDNTVVYYKVDSYYNPEAERCIAWNDPQIKIPWGSESPILSYKDCHAPFFKIHDAL